MNNCYDLGSIIVRWNGEDKKELLLGGLLKEILFLYKVELWYEGLCNKPSIVEAMICWAELSKKDVGSRGQIGVQSVVVDVWIEKPIMYSCA